MSFREFLVSCRSCSVLICHVVSFRDFVAAFVSGTGVFFLVATSCADVLRAVLCVVCVAVRTMFCVRVPFYGISCIKVWFCVLTPMFRCVFCLSCFREPFFEYSVSYFTRICVYCLMFWTSMFCCVFSFSCCVMQAHVVFGYGTMQVSCCVTCCCIASASLVPCRIVTRHVWIMWCCAVPCHRIMLESGGCDSYCAPLYRRRSRASRHMPSTF